MTASLNTIKRLPIEHLSSLDIREAEGPFQPHADADSINLPKRVVLRYHLSPAPGSNIVVALWLPALENWNGCFLGCGNGGPAGSIHQGVLAQRCGEGYAVAQTDLGTSAGPDCGDGNPEVWKDFGYRATELMTATAKQITEAYYQQSITWSYFVGSSTGGQQAMQIVQRNPTDYDGVVAGLPAHCRTPLHAYFLWNHHILTRCPFTEAQEQSVIDAANQLFADREPFRDRMIIVSDPRASQDDIDAVITLSATRDPSITPEHQDALRQIFDGPTHPETGERIFGGVPLGSRFLHAQFNDYLFKWVHGKDCELDALNFAEDIDTYTKALASHLNAENPDISAFKNNKGVLIMTSGTADPIVPYHATLDLVERIIESLGSFESYAAFCRYFLIPGKAHGQGGPGLNKTEDLLPLLRQWREQDQAPDSLHCIKENEGDDDYAMQLTPYPEITLTYQGDTRPISHQRGNVPRVDIRYL